MDPDLALILGLGLTGLSLLGILSAVTDQRRPIAAAVFLLLAGALVLYALVSHPDGYMLGQLPDVFFRVLARFLP